MLFEKEINLIFFLLNADHIIKLEQMELNNNCILRWKGNKNNII